MVYYDYEICPTNDSKGAYLKLKKSCKLSLKWPVEFMKKKCTCVSCVTSFLLSVKPKWVPV